MTPDQAVADANTQRKLQEIFGQRYREGFYGKEREWDEYVHSLGCTRSTKYTPHALECPDSYHRVYPSRWIHVPGELAVRFFVLGLP